MPKINQEEYETLKKKQRKGHKYIAREKEGHVIVFTDYHGKSEYRWLVTINEDDLKYESLFNSSKVFQFIQWEDEEPYNIQELIEEYESEETEVKKDIEWLKSAIQQNLDFYNDNDEEWQMAKVRAYAKSLDLINQLDEPEVLSQEFIDKYKVDYDNWMPAVPIVHLQNLLVPKQEEVDRAYKDGYEKGKQHGFYKGYREGLANKGGEPETVADVVTTFWKSYERLKEVMSMEVKELEE